MSLAYTTNIVHNGRVIQIEESFSPDSVGRLVESMGGIGFSSDMAASWAGQGNGTAWIRMNEIAAGHSLFEFHLDLTENPTMVRNLQLARSIENFCRLFGFKSPLQTLDAEQNTQPDQLGTGNVLGANAGVDAYFLSSSSIQPTRLGETSRVVGNLIGFGLDFVWYKVMLAWSFVRNLPNN